MPYGKQSGKLYQGEFIRPKGKNIIESLPYSEYSLILKKVFVGFLFKFY